METRLYVGQRVITRKGSTTDGKRYTGTVTSVSENEIIVRLDNDSVFSQNVETVEHQFIPLSGIEEGLW